MSNFNVMQKYVTGYSGEPMGYMGGWGQGHILARLWRGQ
jgi:hypothetical protein